MHARTDARMHGRTDGQTDGFWHARHGTARHAAHTHGAATGRFGLGYQLFALETRAAHDRSDSLGHGGIGGAIAMCNPAENFAFAFTCNKIVPTFEVTRRVVEAVLGALNIGRLVVE